jgi:hypothetical protein
MVSKQRFLTSVSTNQLIFRRRKVFLFLLFAFSSFPLLTGVESMFNEIDKKAEDLRSGNLGEEDVAKAFDDIVGTLDEEKPYEAVEIQDRNVGAELDSLAKNLETAASRATLQTDGDMQVWLFIALFFQFLLFFSRMRLTTWRRTTTRWQMPYRS